MKCLRTFLNQTDLDSFLLELHEMIILKLKSPRAEDNFRPEWRYAGVRSQVGPVHTRCPAVSPAVFHRHGRCHLTSEACALLFYPLQTPRGLARGFGLCRVFKNNYRSHIFSL